MLDLIGETNGWKRGEGRKVNCFLCQKTEDQEFASLSKGGRNSGSARDACMLIHGG
jgi:hypothetical protein